MGTQPRARMHAEPEQFASVIEFSGLSYRGLAEDVSRELRKDRGKPRIACSHTVISNLATGKTAWIHPRRAAAIERCLKVPSGHLFRVELFSVPKNDRTSVA
ncbi:hypothetical protein ONA92_02280 [Mycobacteroides salmoniphilum]|uniref:hypothetical protein n=1 Tax=Mycobacteroides salmoniphilum TaxID=404941 RepID=UPI00356241EC